MNTSLNIIRPGRQRGMVTLLISLVMLVTMTLFAVLMSRSSLIELRASANAYRAKQAFESAEAAFNVALAYNSNGGIDHDDDGTVDGVFDTDGDVNHIGDSATTTLDGKNVEARFCTPGDNPPTTCNAPTDFNNVLLWARGWSDDQTAVHVIQERVTFISSLPNGPLVPVVTRAMSFATGNLTVRNPDSNKTIWTGDTISSASGSFETFIQLDSDPALESSSKKTGSVYTLGPDVLQGDSNLSTPTGDFNGDGVVDSNDLPLQFFQNFFGTDKAGFQNSANYEFADCSTLGSLPAFTQPTSIYINGDCTLSTDLGTATAPVILVVNGQLDLNGNHDVYGVLYGDTVIANGGTDITGSILTGDVVSGTGSVSITYSAPIINALENSGARAPINGSWRDF